MLSILGIFMLPLQRNAAAAKKFSCINGTQNENTKKYCDAFSTMFSFPPSQCGKLSLIIMPSDIISKPNIVQTKIACRATFLASPIFDEPIKWAICTAKPDAAALQMPPNNQIVVDTSPIEAESSAPRHPTIDASIYCITIDDN